LIGLTGRALRRDYINVQAISCDFGFVDLDDTGNTYVMNSRFEQCNEDNIFVAKAINSGADVGNLHLVGCYIGKGVRTNISAYKVGTLSMNGGKVWHQKLSANPASTYPSVYIYAKDQGDAAATGQEIIRQFWCNGTSFEGTDQQRSITISSIADGGSGMLNLTLASKHYVVRGYEFGEISGTTSYNHSSVIVDEVLSPTSLRVRKDSGTWTYSGTESGDLILEHIDVWIEGEEAAPSRVLRTSFIGGDINTFVFKNTRGTCLVGGYHGKLAGTYDGCDAGYENMAFGRTGNASTTDSRYASGFPEREFINSEVYREGWYNSIVERYYCTQNGDAWTYDDDTGNFYRASQKSSYVPEIAVWSDYNHGTGIIGGFSIWGEDSAGNKTRYARIFGNVQDDTNGSEEIGLSIQWLYGGVNRSALFRKGVSVGSGGDPAADNWVGADGYEVNGNPGITGTYTTEALTFENGLLTGAV
jgi:hypothetical protein